MQTVPHRHDLSRTPGTIRADDHSALLAEGLTHSAISRRVARGVLVRRHPGVYSFGPGDLSADAQWAAAVSREERAPC